MKKIIDIEDEDGKVAEMVLTDKKIKEDEEYINNLLKERGECPKCPHN